MPTLDNIMMALGGAAFLTFPIVAIGLGGASIAAYQINQDRKKEFLARYFGKDALIKVIYGEIHPDPIEKGLLVQDILLDNKDYTLFLKHERTDWLADLFEKTRLYKPTALILHK